jgi:NADH-quinone oxidoreductase subunit A
MCSPVCDLSRHANLFRDGGKMRLFPAALRLWRCSTVGGNVRAPCVAVDRERRSPTGLSLPSGVRRPPARSGTDMQPVLLGYLPILVFMLIAGVIAVAMVGGSLLVARQKPYPEKVSAYECGFEAFDDARMKFDVRFYLVSLLFIIFDLEVAFLFPWAVAFKEIGAFGFWAMMVFLAILTVGFIYEWRKGALEWD